MGRDRASSSAVSLRVVRPRTGAPPGGLPTGRGTEPAPHPAAAPPAHPLVLALACALLARSALPGDLAPLHVAFCAALPRRALLPGALAALGVVLVRRGPAAAALDALVLALLAAATARRDDRRGVTGRALAAGLACLVGGAAWDALAGLGGGAWLPAAFRGAAAAVLVPVFAGGLQAAGRLATAEERAEALAALSPEDRISLCALAGALLLGLAGLRVGPLDAGQALAATLALWTAASGGAALAAPVAGAYAGLGALTGGLDPVAALVLVGAAVVAGALQGLGWLGVAGGFGLAALVLSALYGDAQRLSVALASHGAGLAAFVAAARGRRLPVPAFALPRPRLVPRPAGAGPFPPEAPAPVPASPVAPLDGLAAACRELAAAVAEEGGAEPATAARPDAAELVGTLAARVCAGCRHVQLCWERDFLRTYGGLVDMLVRQEERGDVDERHLPEHLRRRCPRQPGLVAGVRYLYDLRLAERRERERLREHRQLLARQLHDLGDAVERLARGPRPDGGSRRMAYRVGTARVPRRAGQVSGDSCLARSLSDGRLALVLSDGMGSGHRAAQQSRSAVRLLERLLQAGLDEDDAVRMVNTVLLLRSAPDSFATLDLALVDLYRGHARFVKVGAAPTFLRRGERVYVLRAAAPPAGILPEIEVQVQRRTLMPGDQLVMVSDGVLGAWERPDAGEAWICGYLACLPWDEPRRVAAALVEEALRRCAGRPDDDLSVLALLLR